MITIKPLKDLFEKGRDALEKFDENQLNLNIDNLFTSFMKDVKEISNMPQFNDLIKELSKVFESDWQDLPLFKIVNIYFELIKHKNLQDCILYFLQLFVGTTKSFFDEMEFYDKNLFLEIRNKLIKAKEIKQEYIEKILIEYSNKNESFIKVDDVLKTCLMLRDFYRTQEDDRDVFSQNKLYLGYFLKADFSQLKIFLESLNQSVFKSYLFDFLLKFSYIIESHFRNIIEFLYKLTKFINGEKIYKKDYKFDKILEFLEQDPGLRHYRNSIFHSKFKIIYHSNVEGVRIEFLKNSRPLFRWSIIEMLTKVVNILQLIRTLDIVVLDFDISVEEFIINIKEFFAFINSLDANQQEEMILKGLEEVFGLEKMKMTLKDLNLKL
ncbi:MAG: hypothetical protein ACFFEN_10710 [Candidatus Thorarchaeota archaeon]